MSLATHFTAHPTSVDETYLEHAKCASGYAKELFLAACAAAIHAVFPAFFETTASEKINAMSASIHARHAAAEETCISEADSSLAKLAPLASVG